MKTPTCHPDRKHAGRGLCPQCYKRENYEKNKEKAKARARAWYEANGDKARANAKAWKKANPTYMPGWRVLNRGRVKETQAEWRKENAEALQQYEYERYLADPEKFRSKAALWAKQHPERIREAHLQYAYGISNETFQKMFEEQRGVCAICEETCRTNTHLSVDHDHDSERKNVRGLLCRDCNLGLGYFKDNRPDLLLKAAKYLLDYQTRAA